MNKDTCVNIIALPIVGNKDSREPMNGGLLSRAGVVANSLLVRDGVFKQSIPCSIRYDSEFPLVNNHISESAIYGGILFGHYGHFLVESLSRVSNFDKHRDIFFHVHSSFKWKSIHEAPFFIKDILEHFIGDLNRVKLITEKMYFKSIYVPPPSAQIKDYCSEKHLDFISGYGECLLKNKKQVKDYTGHKIWLSRVSFNNPGDSDKAELCIQEELVKFGYVIVKPESLSLHEQVIMFNTAEVISGFTGSAFHTSMFSRAKNKLIHFQRTQVKNSNFELFTSLSAKRYYYNALKQVTNQVGKKVITQDKDLIIKLLSNEC